MASVSSTSDAAVRHVGGEITVWLLGLPGRSLQKVGTIKPKAAGIPPRSPYAASE